MKKIFIFLLSPLVFMQIIGCVPLIVGAAVGGLGGYAISKDTIQGDTDIDYQEVWNSAVAVCGIRGTLKQEDYDRGYIELKTPDSSLAWVRLIRLTRSTTRLRVSARRHHLPNLNLAQDLFAKIMEEARVR